MQNKQKPSFIGLITARGGSKGVPYKNIYPVAGKPLIAWTIEAANKSNLNSAIISTDDEEIAAQCRKHGGNVPFIRPSELAQDNSSHSDVIRHALNWLKKEEGEYPDYIVLLQPTSPLRTSHDINEAIKIALENQADSVVSLSTCSTHPFWTKQISEQNKVVDFKQFNKNKDFAYLQRQVLPKAYNVNGAIYVIKSSYFLETNLYYSENTYAYIMPQERALDVDTYVDIHMAELLIKHPFQKNK